MKPHKQTYDATTIRYQLTNHLDSASIELDENADIISYEEYHPFGTTSYRSGRSAAEVSLKRYKYVFKELDNETGLYYYGMRYYAPWVARFVSVDPLQFEYPYYTPFQYAGNKPISYIDLDGAEEFYNQEGTLVRKIGKSKDMYVINAKPSDGGIDIIGTPDEDLLKYAKETGIRAYASEKDAAKAWAPIGHSLTRNDPNHFEKAASIFKAKANGGSSEYLYVLGKTVSGFKPDDPGIIGAADPMKSYPTVFGKGLLDVKYNVKKTGTRTKYGTHFSEPGWVYIKEALTDWENEETFEYWSKESYWKHSGFVHTHPPKDKQGNWSLTSGLFGYSGDISYVMDGFSVYLVLTDKAELEEMLLITPEIYEKNPPTYGEQQHSMSMQKWGRRVDEHINF